ncbi:MAG TPA: hypothetical protein VK054_03465, partial [Beutenbergiaceae bacterium]|nr:hypothetical protein [Beutenbergiaceae bacterium]
ATFDLAHMLDDLAAGLETANKRKILDALVEGRGTQGVLDEWSEVVRNAQLTVRISPASRYYLPELAELQHASLMVDRAMRNARVLTRRAATAIEHGTAPQDITAALRRTSGAVRLLGHALGDGQESLQARKELTVVAAMLTPKAHEGWHWQTLILIMRSLIVDLLQATGLSSQAASAHLG